jgi:hypothetical protein
MDVHPPFKLDQSTSRLIAIATDVKHSLSYLLLAPGAKFHL